jgi:hypothetical protein
MRTWLTNLGDRAGARVRPVVPPSGRQVPPAVTVLVRAVVRVVVPQPPVPRPPVLQAPVPRPPVLQAPVPRLPVRPARVQRVPGAPTGIRRLGARRHRITPGVTGQSGVPAASGQLALARPVVAGRPAVLVPLVVHVRPQLPRRGLTVPVMEPRAEARARATRKVASVRIALREPVVLAGRVVPGGLAVPVGPAALAGRAGTVGRRMPIVVTAPTVPRGAQASSMARPASVVMMETARLTDAGTRDPRPGRRAAVVRESVLAMAKGRSAPSGHAARAGPMALLPGGHGRVTTPVLPAAPARGTQARATIVPVMASVARARAANGRAMRAKVTDRAANGRATTAEATVKVANGRATTAEATARARRGRAIPTAAMIAGTTVPAVRVTRTEPRGKAMIARAMANVAMRPARAVPGVRRGRAAPQPLAVPQARVAPRRPVALRLLAGRSGAVVLKGSVVRTRGAARSRRTAGILPGTAGTRGASPATAAPG